MRRHRARSALDAAIRSHRVVVLCGLPCTGRSRLLAQWCDERDDAQRVERLSGSVKHAAPIRVIDHFESAQVDGFVEQFRDLDRQGEEARFVVAPIDLATTRALQRRLTSAVGLVHLAPLQAEDYVAERLEMPDPRDPSEDLVPQARATNAPAFDPDVHLLRGGLPNSLDAESDEVSLVRRRAMIRNLLAHDYSTLNISPGLRLPDLLRWIANKQGDELDEGSCTFATKYELRAALAVFDDLGLTRRLSNHPEGGMVGLGKKHKVYVRDSGLLNALLGVETVEQLRTPSKAGPCWEGYAIESLILAADDKGIPQFYRHDNREIDLVLDFRSRGGPVVAIECKLNPNSQARQGFHDAVKAIKASTGLVVHSGAMSVPEADPPRLHLAAAVQRVKSLVADLP